MSASQNGMRPPPIPIGKLSPAIPMTAKEKEKPKSGGKPTFSCAECKRLKLKCSRVWPCTSCEKRGCAQLCPNGELKTGKGKRLILANTEQLHERITELEIALAQSHAQTCHTPHPLLESPYLFSSRPEPIAKSNEGLLVIEEEVGEEHMVDGAFGTLTIGTEGKAKFVGSFAGSEYLGEGEEDSGVNERVLTPPLTAAGGWNMRDSPSDIPSVTGLDIEELRKLLPVWNTEGKMMMESYWENVNWMYQIIPRPMFDSDHLLSAYDPTIPANAHKLACVFFLMALGVMFDLNRQPYDSRGEELLALGKASLNAVGLEHASPATVQAINLMGTYIMNDKHGNGAEIFWPILGSAVKIAQSLGLHRDGAAFGLQEYEGEERRQVWWEIITYDRLQAMCFGRPCSTSNKSSDTSFPDVKGCWVADKDIYHHSKYRLVQLMEKVIDVQTSTTAVPYTLVQSMDKEVVEFKEGLPEDLSPKMPIEDLPFDPNLHPHLVIHRLSIRLLIAQTRLLLNRAAFTQALTDNSSDPSYGRFGDSFVALFESAQDIVHLVKQLVIYHPSLIARWWFFWFHAFSASVCLAAIAIRAPMSAFASPALSSLSAVCDIAHAAREGCRAKKGLPVLRRLRNRAVDSLRPVARFKRPRPEDVGTEEDDLSHLGGRAKLRRLVNSQSPPSGGLLLVDTSPVARPIETPSPSHTTGSAATSATLADPLHYDPMISPIYFQSQYQSFNGQLGGGAVPPPPADFASFGSEGMHDSWLISPASASNALGSGSGWDLDNGPRTNSSGMTGFTSSPERGMLDMDTFTALGLQGDIDGGFDQSGFDMEAFIESLWRGGSVIVGE